MLFVILIHLLNLSAAEQTCGVSTINKISGFVESSEEFPWMLSVEVWQGSVIGSNCTGILIDRNWILSSPWCLQANLNDTTFSFGFDRSSFNRSSFNYAKELIVEPLQNIGLARINASVIPEEASVICMPDAKVCSELEACQQLLTVGWGRRNNQMLQSDSPSFQTCTNATTQTICTSPNFFNIEAGGALICRKDKSFFLIGVANQETGSSIVDLAAFSNVCSDLAWLEARMKGPTSPKVDASVITTISVVASIGLIAIVSISAFVLYRHLKWKALVAKLPTEMRHYLPKSTFDRILISSEELNWWRHITNQTDPKSEQEIERVVIPFKNLELEEVIGRGHFGIVRKAKLRRRQSVPSITVAVKMRIDGGIFFGREVEFLKEAQAMSRLNHSNILPLIGVAVQPETGQSCIVTPFMERGSLKCFFESDEQRAARLTTPELIDFCVQICSGMVYLEEQQCIHRDLACRNILVSRDMLLKIGDFGFAKQDDPTYQDPTAENATTQSNSTSLVPIRWHPPESFLHNIFEPKSDVWSFGVVMWEIFTLCSSRPFEYHDNDEVKKCVENGERLPKPFRCEGNFYEAVMFPCWAANRADRPSFEQLLSLLNSRLAEFSECYVEP